jgi:hypothetical protein
VVEPETLRSNPNIPKNKKKLNKIVLQAHFTCTKRHKSSRIIIVILFELAK